MKENSCLNSKSLPPNRLIHFFSFFNKAVNFYPPVLFFLCDSPLSRASKSQLDGGSTGQPKCCVSVSPTLK